MELSLEIPIPHINEFLPLTDFSFGLAHLVLDPDMVNYRLLMQGCLLDNGMYELGESLTIEQLLEAAELISPVAVIAPDWESDLSRSVAGAIKLIEARPKGAKWTVGALVQGTDVEERMDCFYELDKLGCEPIGFPFRTPRMDVMEKLSLESAFRPSSWYHLFGMRDWEELSWKDAGRWSIDTGKPFKGYRMDLKSEVRGHGRLQLGSFLSERECFIAAWNIAYMRRLMR